MNAMLMTFTSYARANFLVDMPRGMACFDSRPRFALS